MRTQHVEQWHAALRADGLGNRSIKIVHQILARALKDALKHKLVVRNVATEQRPPKVDSEPVEILTQDQITQLPAQLTGRVVHVPALLVLYTGLRRSELLALQWSDINFDRAELSVSRALEETKELGLRIKKTKSKAANRRLSLSPVAIDLLRQHRRDQLELRMKLGAGRPADNAWVFPVVGTNDLWAPTALSTAWRKFAHKFELGATFHALRHTHASALLAAGVDIVTVSHRLGHASPDITLKVYAHLFHRDDTKAAAAIDAALGGTIR